MNGSLLDQVVVEEQVQNGSEKDPAKSTPSAQDADVKVRSNPPVRKSKKLKPYVAINSYATHTADKKAEKKAKRNGVVLNAKGRALARAKKEKEEKAKAIKALKTSNVKVNVVSKKKLEPGAHVTKVAKVKKGKGKVDVTLKVVEPKAKNKGDALKPSGVCSFCGKPLSRESAIIDGMGDVCARKKAMLKGRSLEEHYADLKVFEQPDEKKYIKVRELAAVAKKQGISGYAVMRGCGGDRMIYPPISEHFRVIIYHGTRYVPKTSLKNLKDLLPK